MVEFHLTLLSFHAFYSRGMKVFWEMLVCGSLKNFAVFKIFGHISVK